MPHSLQLLELQRPPLLDEPAEHTCFAALLVVGEEFFLGILILNGSILIELGIFQVTTIQNPSHPAVVEVEKNQSKLRKPNETQLDYKLE